MSKFEVTSKVDYIPQNPWRPWVKRGQVMFLFGKDKNDVLKYFEPEARDLARRGFIDIKKVI
jgi:hypothetical protein